jgi:aubergine-like protein
MSYNRERLIYRLSVEIKDVPESSKEKRRKIMSRIGFELWQTFNCKFVFDNTMLYVATLPFSEDEPEPSGYSYTARHNSRNYQISLRKAGIVEQGNVPEVTHFYNKFLKEALRRLQYTQIGTRILNPANERSFHRDITLWPGYSVNCIRTQAGCFVKVDSSYKVIHIRTVLDSMMELRNADQIKAKLKKRVVVTRYNNRLYRVDDVDFDLTPESTFTNSAGAQLTYVDYYYQRFGKIIKNKSQPLLKSSIRSRGGERMVVHLIPEFCVLTGVTDETRAAVSRETIVKPNIRLGETLKLAADLNDPELEPKLSKWNVRVSDRPFNLPAEVIDTTAIVLVMASGRTINPREGNGTFSDIKSKMLFDNQLSQVAVMFLADEGHLVNVFMDEMQRQARQIEFQLNCFSFALTTQHSSEWIAQLKTICSQASSRPFIIAFLPGKKGQTWLYDELKEQLIHKYAVGSQIVLTETVSRAIERNSISSICNKVLVQINAKTAGIPWAVKDMPLSESTMIVGIEELRHRTAGNFLGIVSTFTNGLTAPYYSQIFSEYEAPEVSGRIKQGIRNAWYYRDHRRPTRIIIYSSSLEVVQSNHHTAIIQEIEKAMHEIEAETQVRPVLVYVVVNRNTNFRFYASPTSSSNLEAGTIINTHLVKAYTEPTHFRFFLLSLQSRLGVTIPCQYDVMHNTAGVSREDMELLSYKQCYLYYNVYGPCKFPAPLYYAYKLVTQYCERFKKLGRFLEPHANWGEVGELYFI